MISAREVEEAQFRPAGVGQVGYDEAAVDSFLDRAVKTLQAVEAGTALPQNAITSSDVVEATFPERPADSAAGYNLDDVDDLLDAVALRLFKSERNRGQARQQLADRDSQTSPEPSFTEDAGQVGYVEAAAPELEDEPHRVDGDGQDVALRDERDEAAARRDDSSLNAANPNADVAAEPVVDGAAQRDNAVLPGQTMLNIDESRDAAPVNATRSGEQPVWNGWEDPSVPAAAVQPVQQDEGPKGDARQGSSAYIAPTQTVWNGWEDPSAPEVNDVEETASRAPSSADTSAEASTSADKTDSTGAVKTDDSRVADVVGAAGLGLAGAGAAGVAVSHAGAERHERAETVGNADAANADVVTPMESRSGESRTSNNANAVSASSRQSEDQAQPSASASSQVTGINPVGGDPVAEVPVENTSPAQVNSGSINPVGADAETAQTTRPAEQAEVTSDASSEKAAPVAAAVSGDNVSEVRAADDDVRASGSDEGAAVSESKAPATERSATSEEARKDDVTRDSSLVAGGAVAGAAGLAHHESAKNETTSTAKPVVAQATAKTDDASTTTSNEFAGINPVGGDPLEDSGARGEAASAPRGAQTGTSGQRAVGMVGTGVVGAGVVGAGAAGAVSAEQQTDATSRDETSTQTSSSPSEKVRTSEVSSDEQTISGQPAQDETVSSVQSEENSSAVTVEAAPTQATTSQTASEANAASDEAVVSEEASDTESAVYAQTPDVTNDETSDEAPVRRRYAAGAAAGVVGLGAAGAAYEHERADKSEDVASTSVQCSEATQNTDEKTVGAPADATREETFAADEPAQVVGDTSSTSIVQVVDDVSAPSDERVTYVNREEFGEERTVTADSSPVSQGVNTQTDESPAESQSDAATDDAAAAVTPAESEKADSQLVADAAPTKETASARAGVTSTAPVNADASEASIATDAPGTPGEVGWIAPTAADHYGVREDDLNSSESVHDAASAQAEKPAVDDANDAAGKNAAKQDAASQSAADQNVSAQAVESKTSQSQGEEVMAAAAGTAAGLAVASRDKHEEGTKPETRASAEQESRINSDQTNAVQTAPLAPGSEASVAAALADPEQAPAPVEVMDDAHAKPSAQPSAPAQSAANTPDGAATTSAASSNTLATDSATQHQTPVPTNPADEDEVNFHPEYSEYTPGAAQPAQASTTTSVEGGSAADNESAKDAASQQAAAPSSSPYVKRPVANTQPEIDRGPDAGVLPLSLNNQENTVSNSDQASSVGRPEPIDAPSSIDGPEQVKQTTSVPKREENEGALGFVRRLLKRS